MPDVIVDYDTLRHTFSIVHHDEVVSDNSWAYIHEKDGSELVNTSSEKGEDVIVNEGQKWSDFSDAYRCESPGLLEGYGAYGYVLDKSWSTDRRSLLDRGWVIAFADVRYISKVVTLVLIVHGSGLNKSNSIADFVSCAEYLISKGYVHKSRLGAFGGSAGGLLVGAAANRNPELFRAIILKNPFPDVCNTLLDPGLPTAIKSDREEFGNPKIRSHFLSIFSYSPYDNIPTGICCPAMLVTDSRVGVWESAKWVAKVRENACSDCSKAVILETNMKCGHLGEPGRLTEFEKYAYQYAFMMKAMGLMNTPYAI
ncbi:Prolyl endopeptidase [Heracleum sosnowskyi]|uniref:Prolyl endopeptidase n=1 Tax=Heracleum sosnowskyi TaxID=360622 RepID=A0AAD8H7P6_9APIA|nr:Prolyl endopeptidase [Heracleum sosnowskyi]